MSLQFVKFAVLATAAIVFGPKLYDYIERQSPIPNVESNVTRNGLEITEALSKDPLVSELEKQVRADNRSGFRTIAKTLTAENIHKGADAYTSTAYKNASLAQMQDVPTGQAASPFILTATHTLDLARPSGLLLHTDNATGYKTVFPVEGGKKGYDVYDTTFPTKITTGIKVVPTELDQQKLEALVGPLHAQEAWSMLSPAGTEDVTGKAYMIEYQSAFPDLTKRGATFDRDGYRKQTFSENDFLSSWRSEESKQRKVTEAQIGHNAAIYRNTTTLALAVEKADGSIMLLDRTGNIVARAAPTNNRAAQP